MRYGWTILSMIFLTTAILACQAPAPSTSAPHESVVQTAASGSLPESSATQAVTPTLPQEETDMVPVTPPDETAEKLVTLVKQHLAQRLSIAVDQVVLAQIKPVMWRDASLGCPKPGIDYIQMETPGYRISLTADGKTYTYHTDQARRFVQCNK